MPGVWNGGKIERCFMSRELFELTFRVESRVRLSAAQVYNGLQGLIHGDDITEMGRTDSFSWNFTVNNAEAAGVLRAAGSIDVDGRQLRITIVSAQTLEIRVHWLPGYIKDEFLRYLFASYGEVLAVRRDTTVINGTTSKQNGVRVVVLKTDDLIKGNIPHLMRFDMGISMLITIPGRPPLCLRCHEVGHLRRDCNTTTQTHQEKNRPPRTYADAARDRAQYAANHAQEDRLEQVQVEEKRDKEKEEEEEERAPTEEPMMEETEQNEETEREGEEESELNENSNTSNKQNTNTFRPWTEDSQDVITSGLTNTDSLDLLTCGQLQIDIGNETDSSTEDPMYQEAFKTVVHGPKKARMGQRS